MCSIYIFDIIALHLYVPIFLLVRFFFEYFMYLILFRLQSFFFLHYAKYVGK